MKIGIVGAMAQEVEILLSKMADKTEVQIGACRLYQGKIDDIEIALVQSGIGKVAAAMGTTILLQHTNPDAVLNTGSAGGVAAGLSMGDVVISTETRYHDVNVTAFGYQIGQLPNCPAFFESDPILVSLAEHTAKQLQLNVRTGLICTGDRFVDGGEALEQILDDFPMTMALEMEAAAIAQVCYAFEVPFVVVRAISDNGDGDASMSFDEFLPIAAKQSSEMILAMLPLMKRHFN